MSEKKWSGRETHCDLCEMSFAKYPSFFDEIVRIDGRQTWALVCEWCHKLFGTGFGQEYDTKTKLKIRDIHGKK